MLESTIYVICDGGRWFGTLAAASAAAAVKAPWMVVTKATQASWEFKRVRNNRQAWHNNECMQQGCNM
jgi:hypothetical protein